MQYALTSKPHPMRYFQAAFLLMVALALGGCESTNQSTPGTNAVLPHPAGGEVPGYVDQPAIPTFKAPPVYPYDMRRRGISGDVVLLVTVYPDGVAHEISVVEATDPAFGEATVRAVKHWKFQPARLHGAPIASKVKVPMHFRLSDQGTRFEHLESYPVGLAGPVTNPIPPGAPGEYQMSDFEYLQRTHFPGTESIPVAVWHPQPPYPPSANGVYGEVDLVFTVMADGTVANVIVAKAVDGRLGAAAAWAVSHWRFRPATIFGTPVNCRMALPIKFSP